MRCMNFFFRLIVRNGKQKINMLFETFVHCHCCRDGLPHCPRTQAHRTSTLPHTHRHTHTYDLRIHSSCVSLALLKRQHHRRHWQRLRTWFHYLYFEIMTLSMCPGEQKHTVRRYRFPSVHARMHSPKIINSESVRRGWKRARGERLREGRWKLVIFN